MCACQSRDTYILAAGVSRTPAARDSRSLALDYVLLNDYDDSIPWLERALKVDANKLSAHRQK